MLMTKNRRKKGFTLLEMIIYVSIATIVIGVIFSYGWNLSLLRTKNDVVRKTTDGAEFTGDLLAREIRAATEIDEGNSVFNDIPGKIVFFTDEGRVTIESESDKISIKRGEAGKEFVHSDAMRAKNFLLTRQVSGSGETQFVGFSFTMEAYFPEAGARSEYQFSVPWHSGVEIRSQ
jgi:hypothetical protein